MFFFTMTFTSKPIRGPFRIIRLFLCYLFFGALLSTRRISRTVCTILIRIFVNSFLTRFLGVVYRDYPTLRNYVNPLTNSTLFFSRFFRIVRSKFFLYGKNVFLGELSVRYRFRLFLRFVLNKDSSGTSFMFNGI